MKKRSLLIFTALALIPLILFAQISGSSPYASFIRSFLAATTTAAARTAIGAANSGSGGALTNAVIYGSTSGSWTFGSTGTLTSDTARTITTTSGSLTLASGSSHVVLSPSSSVGVGTTGPDAKMDVLSTAGSQYRATYTDGSVYSDWGTLSTGATLWTNSLGHRTTSTTVNDTSVLARQVQGGLAFDGVTTGAKDSHYLNATFAAGSALSVAILVRIPSTNPSSSDILYKLDSTDASYTSVSSLLVYVNSSGTVECVFRDGAGAFKLLTSSVNPITTYGGKLLNFALVRDGTSTPKLYFNGVEDASATISGVGAGFNESITATYFNIGQQLSTSLTRITIFSATLFNRALSASEVITLANQGVQEADKWGSLTAAYDSQRAGGFDSGTDSFTADGTTITGNVDGIGGQDNNLQINGTAATSQHRTYRVIGLTYGKKYKLSYQYYMPVAANPTAKRIYVNYFGNVASVITSPADSAWTTVTLPEFTYTAAGTTFIVNLADASSALTYAGSASDILYLRGVTITQIGSILDADLSAGVGYQVPDRSSNKYHGVVSATGTAWTLAQRRGQVRYTTTGATTGAFQLLSGTAIPANAQIQSIVAWSAGTPLIYVGNATGTSNIVGHTTLTGSTYTKLTQALDFSTTGNLWLNKSATNEVNLTVNYMINDP